MKVAALLVLIVLAAGISPAFAHKSITVDKYTIEIGWKDEPPLVNQQNAITFEFTTEDDSGTSGVVDRKSTRLNSSHVSESRMPSSA